MDLANEFFKYKHVIHSWTFGCSKKEHSDPIIINHVISAIQHIEMILTKINDTNDRNDIIKFLVFAADELYHMAMLSKLEHIPVFHRDYFCEIGRLVSDSVLFADAMALMDKIYDRT